MTKEQLELLLKYIDQRDEECVRSASLCGGFFGFDLTKESASIKEALQASVDKND